MLILNMNTIDNKVNECFQQNFQRGWLMHQRPEKAVLTLTLAQTDTKWNIRTMLTYKQMYTNYISNAVLTIFIALLIKKLLAFEKNQLFLGHLVHYAN